ncbi:XLF-domain-containing protein [Cenococcum geophilum 1.58]|uniref:XLF-domain-containing protein n=1 Tax=Cenococcum geophilum 1.58 TaxID=794803 RepID=UPI00358E892B|nr:XLF-domain-containing protein [Cenococcum geophilum 1.58]
MPLELSNSTKNTPKLLVKASFSSESYQIFVTDLSRIWSEELESRDIIRRAIKDDTAIDPYQNASQLPILLDKIASSVKGIQGTKRRIVETQTDALLLQTTTPLPPPLEALHWNIHLKLLTSDVLKKEFVFPLLASSFIQNQQIADLISHLRDKDNVISKLLDQLESNNVDLSAVFPSVSGVRPAKKATLRQQAARYVSGLGAFDEGQWRVSPKKPETRSVPIFGDLMSGVLSNSDISVLETLNVEGTSGSWWTSLEDPSDEASSAKSGPAILNAEISTPRSVDDEDGDFQRQATPPHLKGSRSPISTKHPESAKLVAHKKQSLMDDDETTEDDDLDAPPPKLTKEIAGAEQSPKGYLDLPEMQQKEKPPSTGNLDTAKPKRLGVIGGSKAKRPTNSHNGPMQPPPYPSVNEDITDEETANEKPSPSPMPEISTTSSDTPQATRKTKLGIIGGKKKNVPEAKTDTSNISMLTGAHVDGMIMGSPQAISEGSTPVQEQAPVKEAGANRYEPRGRDLVGTKRTAPPLRESSRERADRKREELKRELEAKVQAPAKKKRRF